MSEINDPYFNFENVVVGVVVVLVAKQIVLRESYYSDWLKSWPILLSGWMAPALALCPDED